MSDHATAQSEPSPAADLGLVDALAQVSFLVYDTLAEIAGQHELSIIQTRLLGVLRDREPTMITLGQHLGLDKSSVSGLVDRAERRGLVARSANTVDRRSFHVTITDAGRSLVAQVVRQFGDRIASYVAHLAPDQRELLSQLTATIVAADAEHRAIDLRTNALTP